ncbi:MAG: lysozyme [Hyphomicrobiales bacterium]|nr:lysozyme [Hyphomicrobiales bacterium]
MYLDDGATRRLMEACLAMEIELRLTRLEMLAAKAGFDPNQPRIPAGQPGGGQWTRDSNWTGMATPRPPHTLSISRNGITFIAEHEAFKPEVYLDQAGYPTIGYGHKLLSGESYPDGISREEALTLLEKDVSKAESAIQRLVKVSLNQHQYDALVSLVYNIGSGNFASSTLLRLLNQRRFSEAAEQFFVWNKVTVNGMLQESRGLTKRRKQERARFLGKHSK